MSEVADIVEQVRALLREAAQLHHRVYRITDGVDVDWASWYAEWLVDLSELPRLLGPVSRSELTYLLVHMDAEQRRTGSDEPWDEIFARGLVDHFPDG